MPESKTNLWSIKLATATESKWAEREVNLFMSNYGQDE